MTNKEEDFAERVREREQKLQNLNELNSIYVRLLMKSNVYWFSRGFILYRLEECLDKIIIFMTNEQFKFQELSNVKS